MCLFKGVGDRRLESLFFGRRIVMIPQVQLGVEKNLFIRTDPAGNIKADKEKSTERIDGVIALIMALDRAIRCGNDTSASIYDERGILVF